MKHLAQYIKEQRIDEFFGLGSLVKFFKIVFMPWSREAKNWYHKFFMESQEEILEAKDPDKFPKVLDLKYGDVTVEVYDLNDSKSSYKKAGKAVLKNAEKSVDDPMVFPCEVTSTKYRLFYKIFLKKSSQSIIGVVAPDKSKKLNCISSVSDPQGDKKEYAKILKSEKTVKKIFQDIQNCLK